MDNGRDRRDRQEFPLPESVRFISGLLPTTYAVQAMQGLAFDQATAVNPALAVLVLASSFLMAFGLAIYLFNWDSRNSSRREYPLMALLVLIPFVIGILLG